MSWKTRHPMAYMTWKIFRIIRKEDQDRLVYAAVRELEPHASGYAVCVYLDQHSEWNAVATIYRVLGRLEKDGYLTSDRAVATPGGGGKAHKHYATTTKRLAPPVTTGTAQAA